MPGSGTLGMELAAGMRQRPGTRSASAPDIRGWVATRDAFTRQGVTRISDIPARLGRECVRSIDEKQGRSFVPVRPELRVRSSSLGYKIY